MPRPAHLPFAFFASASFANLVASPRTIANVSAESSYSYFSLTAAITSSRVNPGASASRARSYLRISSHASARRARAAALSAFVAATVLVSSSKFGGDVDFLDECLRTATPGRSPATGAATEVIVRRTR